MSGTVAILCPYCGLHQPAAGSCSGCGGRFDIWSIAATQQDMGAWFVRRSKLPHFVGRSQESIVASIKAGELGIDSIVRGPSTRQLWTVARRASGIAHLFGRCYACQGPVLADRPECSACGSSPYECADRNFLGLPKPELLKHELLGGEPVARPAPPSSLEQLLSAGFVREGDLYFVRVAPVPAPESIEVRVRDAAAPVRPKIGSVTAIPAETALAPIEPAATPPSPNQTAAVVAAQKPAGEPMPAEARSGGLSPIDRSMIERARRLERLNRTLLLATVLVSLVALILGAAFVVERDSREADLEAARQDAIRAFRAEFERSAPLTAPKKAELPSEPVTPAAVKPSAADRPAAAEGRR